LLAANARTRAAAKRSGKIYPDGRNTAGFQQRVNGGKTVQIHGDYIGQKIIFKKCQLNPAPKAQVLSAPNPSL